MAAGEPGGLAANFVSWRRRVLHVAISVAALSLALEMSRFVFEQYVDVEEDDEDFDNTPRRHLQLIEEGELLSAGDDLVEGADQVRLPQRDALEDHWDEFEEIRAAFHATFRLLTLALLCAAKVSPRASASRRLFRAAFGCAIAGPYVFAAVPWYETLGFAHIIEGKRGPGMLSVDAGFYRIKLSAQLYGLTSSVLLSVLPAMTKACIVWKMLAPSLTIWGDALTVLPLLYFAVSFSALAVAVQGLGYYEIALYNLLYSGTYLVYLPAASGVNASLTEAATAYKLLTQVAWWRVLVLVVAYS
eukprot:1172544-Prymnesium_polylepis.2